MGLFVSPQDDKTQYLGARLTPTEFTWKPHMHTRPSHQPDNGATDWYTSFTADFPVPVICASCGGCQIECPQDWKRSQENVLDGLRCPRDLKLNGRARDEIAANRSGFRYRVARYLDGMITGMWCLCPQG